MSGGSGYTPGVVQRGSEIIDLVQDTVTKTWTPRQQENGNAITRANEVVRNRQRDGAEWRMGCAEYQP
jgi:hypothetical protein